MSPHRDKTVGVDQYRAERVRRRVEDLLRLQEEEYERQRAPEYRRQMAAMQHLTLAVHALVDAASAASPTPIIPKRVQGPAWVEAEIAMRHLDRDRVQMAHIRAGAAVAQAMARLDVEVHNVDLEFEQVAREIADVAVSQYRASLQGLYPEDCAACAPVTDTEDE